jgi:hypothetical protein
MIRAHYIEIRSRRLPGAPVETIIREVRATNGRGTKSIRVLRGNRTISSVTEPLSPTEKTNIQRRRYTPGLYSSAERRTVRRLSTAKRPRRR